LNWNRRTYLDGVVDGGGWSYIYCIVGRWRRKSGVIVDIRRRKK
jgi:hypothetical protein